MTNKEAIKIVEDMIESMNDINVLYSYEQDALNQLMKTAKEYDVLMVLRWVYIMKEIDGKLQLV